MTKRLFVVGTGTDVGKTYVTGLLCKALKKSGVDIAYFKAAMSGNVRDDNGQLIRGDALCVKDMAGLTQSLDSMCPYVYERALSPHLASRIEGNHVTMKGVKDAYNKVAHAHDYVIMEGSGGIMCPICFDEEEIWLEDIIKAVDAPTIMVADAGLGTINYVALTASYMQSKGIVLKGIIFNNYEEGNVMYEDNVKMCEYLTGVNVVARVKHGDSDIDIDVDALMSMFR